MTTVAEIRDMVAVAGSACPRCGAEEVDGGSVGYFCPTPGCLPHVRWSKEAGMAEVRAVLLAEIDRLRELVRDAERLGASEDGADACPWCSAVAIGQRWGVHMKEPAHRDSCEAFTPDGVVR